MQNYVMKAQKYCVCESNEDVIFSIIALAIRTSSVGHSLPLNTTAYVCKL